MKKIIATLLLSACAASAIQYVDVTTRVTNVVTTTGRITVTNQFTNAVYVAVNSNSVTIGDPLPTAFNKVNTNAWEIYTHHDGFKQMGGLECDPFRRHHLRQRGHLVGEQPGALFSGEQHRGRHGEQ